MKRGLKNTATMNSLTITKAHLQGSVVKEINWAHTKRQFKYHEPRDGNNYSTNDQLEMVSKCISWY